MRRCTVNTNVLFSTDIPLLDMVSLEALMAEMMLNLGEATWGRKWPSGEEKYEVRFEQGVWHLREALVSNMFELQEQLYFIYHMLVVKALPILYLGMACTGEKLFA